jgi:hypothetical protein
MVLPSDESPAFPASNSEPDCEVARPLPESGRENIPIPATSSSNANRWSIAGGAWHVAATLPLALVVFIAGATLLLAMVMLIGHWIADETTTVTDFQWAYGDANTTQGPGADTALAVTAADLTSGQALASTFADTLISNLEEVRELAGRASDDRYWGGYPAMPAPSAVSPLSYQRLGSVGAAGIQIPAGDMLLAVQQLMPFGNPSTLSGTIVEYESSPSRTQSCPPLLAETPATPSDPDSNPIAPSTSASVRAPLICISAHLAGRNGVQHAWSVRCESTDYPRCDGQPAEVQLRVLAKKLAVRVAYDYAHDKTAQYPAPGFQSFGAFLDALAALKQFERTGLEADYRYALGRLVAAQASSTSILASSAYVQFIQGRLYEQAAYYQWADGVIGLISGEPLGINSNVTAYVSPSCSPLQADRQCRAQNSVLAFGAYVCDDVFENIQLHPAMSGLQVGCVIPPREQAYGQLGLADIALDEYQSLAEACRQAEASHQLDLASTHIAIANKDVQKLHEGPAVVTIRAMRAKILEEQGSLAERLGGDFVQYHRDALAQWRQVMITRDVDNKERAAVELHIDTLERLRLEDDLNSLRFSHSLSNLIDNTKRLTGDFFSPTLAEPLHVIRRLLPTGVPQDFGVGLAAPACLASTEQFR